MSTLVTCLLLALATFFWGANFNLSKAIVSEMDPMVAATARFAVAAALMWLITVLRGGRVSLRQHFGAYLLLGLTGVVGFNTLFFWAMQSTTAVNGALIMGLNPLLTSLLAHVALGERLRRKQWFSLPVGVLGVAAVILGGGAHLEIAKGDWLMLGACFSWALYNVLSRVWMPKDEPGLANTTGILFCGALLLGVIAVLRHAPLQMPSLHAGSALLVMIVGGTVLAYLFWGTGIARLGAGRTSLFMNLVPVSSMAISVVTGAMPTLLQFVGAALVIGAVLFASLTPALRKPVVA